MSQTPAVRPPAGRYGPEPTSRSVTLRRAGLVALGVLAAVVLAWVTIGVLREPVQWKDVGFRVDGPTSTQVTFEVTKDPALAVTCQVQALSESYAQVGVRSVDVGPAEVRTQRVTVPVRTSELAVSGVVVGCTPLEDR
ncbi:DUF4307 domain-containing protein [Cellulomonas fimi]|uniref:Secretion protein HlyD family protein n=1 Tax=Cellulomonas fimi (strain ATCC 484 / DSM 20113 / JCM 1341 / CCUG 24087 / LMG 16345 / NBRC 15513 / NCIMB 8980 / NCTC 7547 / NRS-133) TaxID=590998 RepID=F4H8R0_CELFA|nr:DUF4307 domain-containing protein [Cellulomonas fimi]AEE47068.1 secretion protein HlyD family protein [Cellulomonas fimi ATCC 484]VEH35025.1 Uncharacterised protein [Cellulomonas fimi]